MLNEFLSTVGKRLFKGVDSSCSIHVKKDQWLCWTCSSFQLIYGLVC